MIKYNEMVDFTQVYINSINNDKQFHKALKIVHKNSSGSIWLVGGYVFRNIVSALYDLPKPAVIDLDFIVENINANLEIPVGWEVKYNRFGTPRFINGNSSIDLISPPTIHSINRRGLNFSIDNYLTGVPLTIQSIAYDVNNREIVGKIGIKAILKKVVGINNQEEAEYYAKELGISVGELIKEKAENLNFKLQLLQK